jgi:hypothetical protein
VIHEPDPHNRDVPPTEQERRENAAMVETVAMLNDSRSDEDPLFDSKYMVFKREAALSVTDGYVTFKTDDVLDDAVVIRRQDLIAGPVLGAYANVYGAVVKLLTDLHLDSDQIAGIQRAADYFDAQAAAADDEGYKLPD